MSVAEDAEENELRETKYPKLRVLTGGKGPPEEPTTDWLTPLEVGTTFVCRQNKTTVDGELYHLLFKGIEFFLLKYVLPDGKIWDRYVSPESFCKLYKEHEVLTQKEPEKLAEGVEDGNSDRTD